MEHPIRILAGACPDQFEDGDRTLLHTLIVVPQIKQGYCFGCYGYEPKYRSASPSRFLCSDARSAAAAQLGKEANVLACPNKIFIPDTPEAMEHYLKQRLAGDFDDD